MEAVKRFKARAARSSKQLAEQYLRSAERLGQNSFMKRIHETYRRADQTLMKRNEISGAGRAEALLELEAFLKKELADIKREKTAMKKPTTTEMKQEAGAHTLETKDTAALKEYKEEIAERTRSSLGRRLRSLGKSRITKEGEGIIKDLLGDKVDVLKDAIALGDEIDHSKLKVVRIIKDSKDTAQGKSTVNPKPQTFGCYIKFPKARVMERLMVKGLVDKRFRPISCARILNADDITIIKYFDSLARGLLNYYSPASNF